MENGLAVQTDELLATDLRWGGGGGGASAARSQAQGAGGLGFPGQEGMRSGAREPGVSALVGVGLHLVHDRNVSGVGPEAVVHRDEGQALPAAAVRGPRGEATP